VAPEPLRCKPFRPSTVRPTGNATRAATQLRGDGFRVVRVRPADGVPQRRQRLDVRGQGRHRSRRRGRHRGAVRGGGERAGQGTRATVDADRAARGRGRPNCSAPRRSSRPTSTGGPTSARASTNSSRSSIGPGSAACCASQPTVNGSTYSRPSTRSSGCTQSGERRSLNARNPSPASASLRLLVMPMRSYRPR
jgi:hypothetical protein